MKYVHVVRKNSDTVEGRGPMIVDSIWAGEAEKCAKKYMDEQPGIMGRKGEWSKDRYGDWTIERVPVIQSYSTKKDTDSLLLREKALRKLTKEEKVALGVEEL